jgi:hypothetical protein
MNATLRERAILWEGCIAPWRAQTSCTAAIVLDRRMLPELFHDPVPVCIQQGTDSVAVWQ